MQVTKTNARFLSASALVILAGIVLSGPVTVVLVELLVPQPPWLDAATFIQHYSWLQTLTYVFGFLILGGCVAFMAGLISTAHENQRPLAFTAFGFTCVAAAMVFTNYVLQTGYIPQALDGDPGILAMVTMANPRSFAWALEMYGYGIFGVASLFAAPIFDNQGRQRVIRILFIVNGVASIVAAFLVPLIPGWLLTVPGLTAGAAWNILLITLMAIVIREFRFGRGR